MINLEGSTVQVVNCFEKEGGMKISSRIVSKTGSEYLFIWHEINNRKTLKD